jgi:hypothetical protein
MSWFDRNRGEEEPAEAWARLSEVVEHAGVAAALHAASGTVGLRRFVVRFEVRGGRLRIIGLDAEPLAKGGGPPNPTAFAANVGAVEAALRTLQHRLPAPFTFDRGAVGVLRGEDGEISLAFRFEEDADAYTLAEIPVPAGAASPLEEPRYLAALATWESRINAVRARWVVPGAGDEWSLDGPRLTLTGPAGVRVLGADAIATFWPRGHRFEWLVDAPVAEEAPFVEPVLTVETGGAMELAVFAAARMKRVGVFQGEIAGERGEILFAALRE